MPAASDVYVKVRVGVERYALPIGSVLEVAKLGDLTTLPGAGPGVLGVRNFHGQVLPVFDLAHVLGSQHDGDLSHFVVADHGDHLAGLAVDEIASVGPLTGELEDAESDYLTSTALENGQLVGVVDVDRLFAAFKSEAA